MTNIHSNDNKTIEQVLSTYQAIIENNQHTTLIVSNYPESIDQPGEIINQSLTNQPTRFFYHHKNTFQEPLELIVFLENDSESSATISLVSGQGGGSLDMMQAGHRANEKFLSQLFNGAQQLMLPPKSLTPVLNHPMKSNHTISGILQIFNDSKATGLSIKSVVVDPRWDHLQLSNIKKERYFNPLVFNNALKYSEIIFDAAQHIDLFQFGGLPYEKCIKSGKALKGNYGWLYVKKVQLINSSEFEKTVEFIAFPEKQNAVHRMAFFANDDLLQIPFLKSDDKMANMATVYRETLLPNQEKYLLLMTIPQGGSYYPIDIMLKTIHY